MNTCYSFLILVFMVPVAIAVPNKKTILANSLPYTFTAQLPFDNAGALISPNQDATPFPEKVTLMPIIPYKRLAKGRACYTHNICTDKYFNRYKGIRCCQKQDKLFLQMQNDSINYVIDSKDWVKIWQRFELTSYLEEYEIINGVKLNRKLKKFIPPKHTQARVANTYLYYQK